MKESLQFCHDYQNRNGCTRENCKYIHATKEEQNIYIATGQIPQVIAEQQSTMAMTTSNMQASAETIPQIAMFISESFMAQPPPAPWPPLPPPQAVLQPVSTAPPPPPPPSSPPRHAPTLQPIQAQPPPPPAPTPSVGQLRPVSTAYPAMPPLQTTPVMFSMNQPPPMVPPEFDASRPPPPIPTHVQSNNNGQLKRKIDANGNAMPPLQTTPVMFSMNQPPPMVPPEFDASRPPPPIPTHVQSNNNGQLKRKIDANGNAATTKLRKPEGSEVTESLCENCVQREIRINGYKQQMESLHNEEETQILLYKKKLQEYEIGRDILKTIVGPELFVVFDNLIEGAQTPPLDNPGTSFMSGSSTVSMQTVLQFFKMLLGSGGRNVVEAAPSTSHMEDNLQSLTRRINVANYANPGPDLIKFVMETLRNSSVPERASSVEERPIEPVGMSRSNGFMANGQKAGGGGMSETARFGYAAAGAQGQEYGARALPSYSGAGPSGFAAAAPVPAPPPPAAYPMFHPAVPPPPSRQYYQSPAGPGPSNIPYNGAEIAPGPGPSQGMPPTTSAALRPSQANAPNYNYMGRYPQPPFFPPYQ